MSEIRSLIKDFLAITGDDDDERRLKLAVMEAQLEKTRAETEKLKGGHKEGNGGVNLVDDIGEGGGNDGTDN